jgi:hypothetical protein
MPHDLFGDVVVRPASAGSRRSSVVVFSVVAHAAALVALVIVPLFAADTLPTPKRVIRLVPAERHRAHCHTHGSASDHDCASRSAPTVAGHDAGHAGADRRADGHRR